MSNSSRENSLDQFERLASLAREESPPVIDVRDRVLVQLRERSAAADVRPRLAPPDREWVGLIVGAGIAITAAAIALMIGVPTWESMNDPLAGWFDQFNVVIQ
jgi:hypothetical protein